MRKYLVGVLAAALVFAAATAHGKMSDVALMGLAVLVTFSVLLAVFNDSDKSAH